MQSRVAHGTGIAVKVLQLSLASSVSDGPSLDGKYTTRAVRLDVWMVNFICHGPEVHFKE